MIEMDSKNSSNSQPQQLAALESENIRLKKTVDWMHEMIWDLIRRERKGRPTSSINENRRL